MSSSKSISSSRRRSTRRDLQSCLSRFEPNVNATSTETRLALEVEGVGKHFDGVKALDGISMRLDRGEILGVIGPNGSGKTTLLNVITGVIKADAGTIRCGEVSWRWLPPPRISRLGIARTFQNIRLFEGMTVAEHLEVAAGNSDKQASQGGGIESIMAELELESVSASVAETLSYGMQRRVELARALASDPHFLLLDEPAAGLNPAETENLHHDLIRLRDERGCGLVLIDHDVRLIMRTCQRVMVLSEGRVISEGPPEEVRRDRAVIEAYLG